MNRLARRTESGSVSVLIAVLGVAFLMVAGLALDGGRKLGALSTARNTADNAARAGAQAIDLDTYHLTGTPTLDPDAATAAALDYLASVGHTGTVTVNGPTISVTVHINVPTRFLPGPLHASATETATAIFSIEGTP